MSPKRLVLLALVLAALAGCNSEPQGRQMTATEGAAKQGGKGAVSGPEFVP